MPGALSVSEYLPDSGKEVVITIFYGEKCPHCHEELEWLETIEDKYPTLVINKYEIWTDAGNLALFKNFSTTCEVEPRGVPATFIGETFISGFRNAKTTGAEIESEIQKCLASGHCHDPREGHQSCEDTLIPDNETNVNLPVLGDVDTSKLSLPAFTVVLGALDGFNPCAFFVLLFLLSMLIHAKSRVRMLIIGGTFIFFSALIYFLFMAAWLNIFIIAGNLKWVTLIAGFLAVGIALINIKDFFWFKKGVSLTIKDEQKKSLFGKMRYLLKSPSIWSMIGATVVLAISANAYELLCTAGFPMVFTRILTLNNLSPLAYYLYLALYNVVYVVPLLIIVLIFTATLGAKKLSQSQGESLKLISGAMMLGLGITLLFFPQQLSNLKFTLVLLGIAIVVPIFIINVKKKIDGEKNG